jgi:S-adenosylmethionine:tRNA ribosyltransferase-isomerase
MQVSAFHFDLPPELIAQRPLADRAASRLLQVRRTLKPALADRNFREFADLLRPRDLVVFNNTRVFPARLFGRKNGHATRIEVLLTKQTSEAPCEWECLVRPGKKVGVGEGLIFGDPAEGDPAELEAEVVARRDFGERSLRFKPTADFFGTLERLGHVPLPPYIDRNIDRDIDRNDQDRNDENRNDEAVDRQRYQTVYASERGSVAAPTAGLHFTPEVLQRLRERGIETAEVTLHVGLGTFQPVRVERVEDHRLHGERYQISPSTAEKINAALAEGRRLVAVGTTTVRTLEYAAQRTGTGRVEAGSGEANLFIYPGFEFRAVGAMLTNFHLPESTLLMLVCAFGGHENILGAYRHAVEQRYRFYSYGDCMFVE